MLFDCRCIVAANCAEGTTSAVYDCLVSGFASLYVLYKAVIDVYITDISTFKRHLKTYLFNLYFNT